MSQDMKHTGILIRSDLIYLRRSVFIIVVVSLVIIIFRKFCSRILGFGGTILLNIVRVLGPPLQVGFEINIILASWKVILIVGRIKVIVKGVVISILSLLEVLTIIIYHGAISIFLGLLRCSRLSLFLFFFLKLACFLALIG